MALLSAAIVAAQVPSWQDPARAIVVRSAETAPLEIVTSDCGRTEIRPRGGVAVIDLDCRVELRNEGRAAVRGAALAVSTLPTTQRAI